MLGSPHHNQVMNMFEDDELTRARYDDERYAIEFGGPSTDEPQHQQQEQEQPPNQRPKKRSYRRHTQEQIDGLDAFFRHNAHPDENQRKELSLRLGLDPLQVKFWFQNRRTGLKVRGEREENEFLKAEIEKLRAEMNRYKETMGNPTCNVCGTPATLVMSHEEQQLRLENALLRKELERFGGQMQTNHADSHTNNISASVLNNSNQAVSHSVGNYNNGSQHGMVGEAYAGGGSELVIRSSVSAQGLDDRRIVELAVVGMDELIRLTQASGPPLWFPTNFHADILNGEEYMKQFPRSVGPNPLRSRTDGSKESAVVIIDPITLVDILMDVNRWSNMFCGIVARASILKVLSTGVAGSYNGALQVMSAEFQVPSPSVPTRENYFVRYCKQLLKETWVVADVPLDNFPPTSGNSVSKNKRRPSGCLIQELPNGYSKVTWVEHLEIDDNAAQIIFNDNVVQTIYTPLINSGLAFGAKRWIAILQRQCQRLAYSMSNDIPITGEYSEFMNHEGKKSMLKLAERMVTSFSTSIGASTVHAWTNLLSDGSEVKVMTRKYYYEPESGRPADVVLSAATSFWLPIPPKRLFDFLHSVNSRNEWDILSNGSIIEEMTHIANGGDPGNCVSLIRVGSANTSENNNNNNMMILQESCTDITGSYVVYAPVDMNSLGVVFTGGDSDRLPLLPSGFAIHPDGGFTPNGGSIMNIGSGGSLITVALQILVNSVPHARLALNSVTTVNTLIKATVKRIKTAVMPNVT